jgi:hypothetical protein
MARVSRSRSSSAVGVAGRRLSVFRLVNGAQFAHAGLVRVPAGGGNARSSAAAAVVSACFIRLFSFHLQTKAQVIIFERFCLKYDGYK